MNRLTYGQVREMLLACADRIIRNEPYLTKVDSAIGDGDHGNGMLTGMKAAEKVLEDGQDGTNSFGLYADMAEAMQRAMGGASGGYTASRQPIVDLLRQRSRPYLFSNSMAPGLVAAGIRMFDMMSETNELQDKLHENTDYFLRRMKEEGFDCKPSESAICAVMIYDAAKSQQYAAKMQEEGIFVTGFYYPVVPKGQARIRVQISAAHEHEHLDKCIEAFKKVRKEIEG